MYKIPLIEGQLIELFDAVSGQVTSFIVDTDVEGNLLLKVEPATIHEIEVVSDSARVMIINEQ